MKMLLIVLCTCIWGLGFVATRYTLDAYTPIWSNTIRFLIAGTVSIPILLLFYRKKRPLKDYLLALSCSCFLMVAMQLQTIGIAQTSLAKSGFFTTFYAIFTPLIYRFILGHHLRRTYWLLISLALVGIAFLCELQWSQFNRGDLFVLASAFFFACHILMVDYTVEFVEAFELNFIQSVFMGITGVFLALLTEGMVDFAAAMSQPLLFNFLVLGILSSLLAFGLQNYSQQFIAPHVVSLLFLTESLWASLFGLLFFGETLSNLALIGALLVLSAVALIPKFAHFQKQTIP